MRSVRLTWILCLACAQEPRSTDRGSYPGANTDPSNCTAVTNVALVPGPTGTRVVETSFRDLFPYEEISAYVQGETAGLLMDVRHTVDEASGETTATVVLYDRIGWAFPVPPDAGPDPYRRCDDQGSCVYEPRGLDDPRYPFKENLDGNKIASLFLCAQRIDSSRTRVYFNHLLVDEMGWGYLNGGPEYDTIVENENRSIPLGRICHASIPLDTFEHDDEEYELPGAGLYYLQLSPDQELALAMEAQRRYQTYDTTDPPDGVIDLAYVLKVGPLALVSTTSGGDGFTIAIDQLAGDGPASGLFPRLDHVASLAHLPSPDAPHEIRHAMFFRGRGLREHPAATAVDGTREVAIPIEETIWTGSRYTRTFGVYAGSGRCWFDGRMLPPPNVPGAAWLVHAGFDEKGVPTYTYPYGTYCAVDELSALEQDAVLRHYGATRRVEWEHAGTLAEGDSCWGRPPAVAAAEGEAPPPAEEPPDGDPGTSLCSGPDVLWCSCNDEDRSVWVLRDHGDETAVRIHLVEGWTSSTAYRGENCFSF